MGVQTLKLAGKEFVVVPAADYRELKQQARAANRSRNSEQARQDAGDIAEVKRRKARGEARPYSELRKKLGLA